MTVRAAFVLCWCPYFVFDLLDVYQLLPPRGMQRRYAVSVFIQSLAPLNSLANPIIYGLFSRAAGRAGLSRVG